MMLERARQALVFLLLFVCLSGSLAHALLLEPYPEPTLSGPRDTMNYFLKTMVGHKMGDPQGLDLAVEALNTSELDSATRQRSARLLARRLIETLDRLERIDIETIPETLPDGQREWVFRKQSVEDGRVMRPVVIAIGEDDSGLWRFTPETLATIELFERSIRHYDVVDGVVELSDWRTQLKSIMPSWTGERGFILLHGQWIGLFFVIFFAFLFEKLIGHYIGRAAQKWLATKRVQFNQKSQNDFTKPIGIALFAFFWNFGVQLLELPDDILSIFLRGGIIVLTLASVKTALNFVDLVSLYFEQVARGTPNALDDILVPLFSKTAKFFILCVGIVMVGNSLTLDMKGIIAGMGIGGIAFALAAKDTVSNFFGSLTVILDRPFSIGDWVSINGNVEGMVEEVGLRSTRIRTFYDSQVTLPNGQLTNVHIDNYGRRTYRRLVTTLSVQYDTPPEKLEAFCEGIRQIILRHRWTRKDLFHVYFNNYGASSLDIMLYLFWKVPDWSSELQERHRLLLDILRLANEMDIRFAFPTQTLHVFQEGAREYNHRPAREEIFGQGASFAEQIASKQLTHSGPRSRVEGDGKLPEPKQEM